MRPALLGLLLAPGLHAADLKSEYRIDTWKAEHGLPQNTVPVIHQAPDGYLWFSTWFGLVRFDGNRFQVFERSDTPGLAFTSFRVIATDLRDGSLWLGSRRGVTRMDRRIFQSILLQPEDQSELWSLCPSRDGGIWVAATNGLLRIESLLQPSVLWKQADGLLHDSVRTVHEQKDGRLWVGSDGGLQMYDPRSGTFASVEGPSGPIDRLFEDGSSRLWVSTLTNGLWWVERETFRMHRAHGQLKFLRIMDIADDSEGNLWMVDGQRSLFRQTRTGDLEYFLNADFLAHDRVLTVREDREKNLWIGTESGGLHRLQRRWIASLSTRDGLVHKKAWSICTSRHGGLWIGTEGGVSRLTGTTFTNYPMKGELDHKAVRVVFEDREGVLWIGTSADGLKWLRDGVLAKAPLGLSRVSQPVYAVTQDRRDRVWVGTTEGIFLLENYRQVAHFTTEHGLGKNDVRCIRESRDGSLWVGTYGGGVSRLPGGQIENRFECLTTADGLSNNDAWAIHEDASGVIWVGTEEGLTRIKDGRLFSFTRKQGLYDNAVIDLLTDDNGDLWVGSNRGIYRMRLKDLNEVAEGRSDRVNYVVYGTSDGMLSGEINGENTPAACRVPTGEMWFPSMDGIIKIDPRNVPRNTLVPPVVIEEVLAEGVSLNPLDPQRIAPGKGGVIEFTYTANCLVAADKVLFRYRLDGFDRDWIQAGTRRVAHYTNLRPGAYTFRVTACNNHGVWNETGSAFEFILEPRVQDTFWFRAACVAGAVLIAYTLHRRHVLNLGRIERLKRQNMLERERSRIANEMHDDLGSSLTRIALISEQARKSIPENGHARDHIGQITETTREVFRAMDEIVWALNPRHDTFDSLVGYLCTYAQKFLRPVGIRCLLDLPEQLPVVAINSDERHNVFLTFKEAINNIVKHAAATEVWIRVKLERGQSLIEIEDNGRGFAGVPDRHEGRGLDNMKQRLQSIGGRLEVTSRAGLGTCLTLVVPLRMGAEVSSPA